MVSVEDQLTAGSPSDAVDADMHGMVEQLAQFAFAVGVAVEEGDRMNAGPLAAGTQILPQPETATARRDMQIRERIGRMSL